MVEYKLLYGYRSSENINVDHTKSNIIEVFSEASSIKCSIIIHSFEDLNKTACFIMSDSHLLRIVSIFHWLYRIQFNIMQMRMTSFGQGDSEMQSKTEWIDMNGVDV